MSYQYTYLLIDLLGLLIWLPLFFVRKDTRKEMIIMSLLFGFVAIVTEPIYLLDWWKPLTITGTAVGLEDFLYGFMVGGIGSVIYEVIFQKRMQTKRMSESRKERQNIFFYFFGGVFAFVFFGSFLFLGFNTLISTIIAFIFGLTIIFIRRKDLIINSLVTGILLLLISFIIYSIGEVIFPGWVRIFWFFKNVPDIIIFNVPIDDVIFVLLAGSFIAPLYEFWQEVKLRRA